MLSTSRRHDLVLEFCAQAACPRYWVVDPDVITLRPGAL